MKIILIGIFNLAFFSAVKSQPPPTNNLIYNDSSKTQRIVICAPSRSQTINQPLYVIVSHDKKLIFNGSDTAHLNSINPNWIKSINILKDSSAIKKYGEAAKNGVVEVILNDEKFPDAFKTFQEQQ